MVIYVAIVIRCNLGRPVLKIRTVTVEKVIRYDIVESTDKAKKKSFDSSQRTKEEKSNSLRLKTEKEIRKLENEIQRSNRIIQALQVQIRNSEVNFDALDTKDSEELKMTDLLEEIEMRKIKFKNQNFYIEEKQSELRFMSESASILRSAIKSKVILSQQDIEYLKVIQFKHTYGMNTRLVELKEAIDLQKPWIVNV